MPKNYGKASRRKSQPEPESEDEAEYEVEKVISHRRLAKKYALEYYVSWVGYPGELTWIEEESAEGCPELVNKYWAKVPAKEAHERFPPGSEEEAEAMQGYEQPTKGDSKKRRASKVVEDDDEEEEEAPKSRRKSAASTKSNGTSSKAKKASPPPKKEKKEKKAPVAKKAKKETKVEVEEEQAEEEQEEEVDEENVVDDHKYSTHDQKYADKEHDWDELVKKVDTVDNEPEENTGLRFLLEWKEDGTVTYVPSAIARERCPQRIIDFFTMHLKFRQPSQGQEEE